MVMVRVSINIILCVSHLIDSFIYVRNNEPLEYRTFGVSTHNEANLQHYVAGLFVSFMGLTHVLTYRLHN